MTKQEVIKYYTDERDRIQNVLSRATAGGGSAGALDDEEVAEFRADLEGDLQHANEMIDYWQSE